MPIQTLDFTYTVSRYGVSSTYGVGFPWGSCNPAYEGTGEYSAANSGGVQRAERRDYARDRGLTGYQQHVDLIPSCIGETLSPSFVLPSVPSFLILASWAF